MTFDFEKVLFPSNEQIEKYCETFRRIHEKSIKEKGRVCTNCKYNIYIQESPYSDRMDCKFGDVDVSKGCKKYEESNIEEIINKYKQKLKEFKEKHRGSD